MSWGRKPAPKGRTYKRMSTQDRSTILDWADDTGTAVAKALNEYRRHGDRLSLDDAKSGLLAVLSCVEVLQDREQGR
jgi:hypothetical protein